MPKPVQGTDLKRTLKTVARVEACPSKCSFTSSRKLISLRLFKPMLQAVLLKSLPWWPAGTSAVDAKPASHLAP